MIRVSFILVNWRTKELTAQAVESILRFEAGALHEILVVDSASGDGSAGYLRARCPGIEVIEAPENRGFASASNLGASRARGEWLIHFNSDAYLKGAILDTLLEAAAKIGKPCILGCRVLSPDGADQATALAFPTLGGYFREAFSSKGAAERRRLAWQREKTQREFSRVDWVSGVFLMIRRSDYQQLGGMDASIFMYGEDVEFCRRAAAGGIASYYVPGVAVVHLGGGSAGHATLRSLTLTDRGRIRAFALMHGPGAALALRGIFLFRSALRVLLFLGPAAVSAGYRAKLRLHLRETLLLSGIAR